MDGLVVEVAGGRQVRVDELPHVRVSVGEADVLNRGRGRGGLQVLAQQLHLRALATAIHALEEDEGAATLETGHLEGEREGEQEEGEGEQQGEQQGQCVAGLCLLESA